MIESATPVCPLGKTPLVFNEDAVLWWCPDCGWTDRDSNIGEDDWKDSYASDEEGGCAAGRS